MILIWLVVECNDPGGVDNAVRGGSSWPYTVGRTFTYTCESCYTGGGFITCERNGQWTQKPSCTGKDIQMQPVLHRRVANLYR